jgi:hypothetical protein
MFLLINSHVSTQIDHHHVILQEETFTSIVVCMYSVTICVFLQNYLVMTSVGRNML